MSATITLSQEHVNAHAKVMLGYTTAFAFAVGLQLVGKLRSMTQYAKQKKELEAKGGDSKGIKYNRYTDSDALLLASDRAVGNFVEWAPSFLALFGTHALVAGDCTTLGWSYVALRFLYPILAVSGGIKHSGARPLIFLATMPMYVVLIKLAAGIAAKVM